MGTLGLAIPDPSLVPALPSSILDMTPMASGEPSQDKHLGIQETTHHECPKREPRKIPVVTALSLKTPKSTHGPESTKNKEESKGLRQSHLTKSKARSQGALPSVDHQYIIDIEFIRSQLKGVGHDSVDQEILVKQERLDVRFPLLLKGPPC
jgi:hypothetical protein